MQSRSKNTKNFCKMPPRDSKQETATEKLESENKREKNRYDLLRRNRENNVWTEKTNKLKYCFRLFFVLIYLNAKTKSRLNHVVGLGFGEGEFPVSEHSLDICEMTNIYLENFCWKIFLVLLGCARGPKVMKQLDTWGAAGPTRVLMVIIMIGQGFCLYKIN